MMPHNQRFWQFTPRRIGREISVKTAAEKVRAFAYAEMRLMELQAGWLASIAPAELKIELGYQLYEDACHADALIHRLPELGIHDGNIAPLHEGITQFFNEIANTDDLIERLMGLFWVVRPHLSAVYQRYIEATDVVSDGPTVRILQRAKEDHARFAQWGNGLLSRLIETASQQERVNDWLNHLLDALTQLGGIDGDGTASGAKAVTFRNSAPPARFSVAPPVRDERFQIAPYVRREGRAATDVWDHASFVKYMFMMVEGELEVTEVCGRTLADFPDAPWELRFVIARQLWDEARHAELSLQRFLEIGGTLDLLPVRDTFPLFLAPVQHQDLVLRLAHVNQVVEGWVTDDFAMMVDICHQLGDERSAHLFEQLIVDEWLHLKIGADWIPKLTAHDAAYRAEVVHYRLQTEQKLYSDLAHAADDVLLRHQSHQKAHAQPS